MKIYQAHPAGAPTCELCGLPQVTVYRLFDERRVGMCCLLRARDEAERVVNIEDATIARRLAAMAGTMRSSWERHVEHDDYHVDCPYCRWADAA